MEIASERHPLEPFLPEGARILMLGSFPPKKEKWSMEFFYPNWINDMWRIIGLVFFNDKDHFVYRNADGTKERKYDRNLCISFAESKGMALYDTAIEVRRLKDNASDKFLEVLKATDIMALLECLPECRAIAATGQKATDLICRAFSCEEPAAGNYISIMAGGRTLRFWRMPSSSRAYPLPTDAKAEIYSKMFITEGLK